MSEQPGTFSDVKFKLKTFPSAGEDSTSEWNEKHQTVQNLPVLLDDFVSPGIPFDSLMFAKVVESI
jgi:hypothetical protein